MNPTHPHRHSDRLVGKSPERQAKNATGSLTFTARESASPTGTKNQRRFKNYLIDSSVQLKIAATNLGYMLVVMVILISVLIPQYLEMWRPADPHYQLAAAKLFLLLLDQMALAVVAIFIIAFAHQVLMTHRICGPLVNFSNTFQSIRNLDLTRRVHLRRSDLLKRTANEINEMSAALVENIKRIQTDQEALEKDLADAVVHLDNPQTLARILASARKHADNCSSGLMAFRLPDNMNHDVQQESLPIPDDSGPTPPQIPTGTEAVPKVND